MTSPLFAELLKVFVTQVADAVAERITNQSPAAAPKPDTLFKPEVTADRSPEEWRADCLAIVHALAPNHGPELRALFNQYNGAGRLKDIGDEHMPAILTELVSLRDAK